jgi:hypothetical protein
MWQYVVYNNPTDYPGQYVVRRCYVNSTGVYPEAGPRYVGPSLVAARETIPPGLHRIDRFPEDDPCILEVWL